MCARAADSVLIHLCLVNLFETKKTPHLGLSENRVTPKVDGLLYHPFPLQIASKNLSNVYYNFQLSR